MQLMLDAGYSNIEYLFASPIIKRIKEEGLANPAEFKIRATTEDDVPLILALIKELAEYEELSHEVEATEADIRQSLFGDRPVAEALIGELEGNPISFALFFHNFSTFLGKPVGQRTQLRPLRMVGSGLERAGHPHL